MKETVRLTSANGDPQNCQKQNDGTVTAATHDALKSSVEGKREPYGSGEEFLPH